MITVRTTLSEEKAKGMSDKNTMGGMMWLTLSSVFSAWATLDSEA